MNAMRKKFVNEAEERKKNRKGRREKRKKKTDTRMVGANTNEEGTEVEERQQCRRAEVEGKNQKNQISTQTYVDGMSRTDLKTQEISVQKFTAPVFFFRGFSFLFTLSYGAQ